MNVLKERKELVLKDIEQFGPAHAAEIYRLNFRDLVSIVSGNSLDGTQTLLSKDEQQVYRRSGLAITEFPPYWQQELLEQRNQVKKQEMRYYEDRQAIAASLADLRREQTSSFEHGMYRERKINSLEKLLFTMPEKFDSYFHPAYYGIKGAGTLVIQYEKEGNIIEVYSALLNLHETPTYRIVEFTKAGELVSEEFMPHRIDLFTNMVLAGLGAYAAWKFVASNGDGENTSMGMRLFAAFAATSILGLGCHMLYDFIQQPLKKSFEKRMLAQAQKNWESLRVRTKVIT